jgi:hypothetical protein
LFRPEVSRSAIKAIVSRIVTSARQLSGTASAELHRVAIRDDLAQPDETLIWLRTWTAQAGNQGKKAVRSKQDKTFGTS